MLSLFRSLVSPHTRLCWQKIPLSDSGTFCRRYRELRGSHSSSLRAITSFCSSSGCQGTANIASSRECHASVRVFRKSRPLETVTLSAAERIHATNTQVLLQLESCTHRALLDPHFHNGLCHRTGPSLPLHLAQQVHQNPHGAANGNVASSRGARRG